MSLHYLVKYLYSKNGHAEELSETNYYARLNHSKQLSKNTLFFSDISIITFCVSHRRCKMYSGHVRLCLSLCVSVCLYVCPRPHAHIAAQTRCNLGAW